MISRVDKNDIITGRIWFLSIFYHLVHHKILRNKTIITNGVEGGNELFAKGVLVAFGNVHVKAWVEIK